LNHRTRLLPGGRVVAVEDFRRAELDSGQGLAADGIARVMSAEDGCANADAIVASAANAAAGNIAN
jgi:hypothetical protein